MGELYATRTVSIETPKTNIQGSLWPIPTDISSFVCYYSLISMISTSLLLKHAMCICSSFPFYPSPYPSHPRVSLTRSNLTPPVGLCSDPTASLQLSQREGIRPSSQPEHARHSSAPLYTAFAPLFFHWFVSQRFASLSCELKTFHICLYSRWHKLQTSEDGK